MAVGDQELRIREPLNGVVLDTPEPVAADGEVGLALRKLDGIAVMEQEDRLELRPRRAEQPQAALLRAGVRALVRQHDAVLVRLEPQGDDEPVARPLDPVRPEVSLRQRPGGWPGLAVEHALGFPVGQVARGLPVERIRILDKRMFHNGLGRVNDIAVQLLCASGTRGRFGFDRTRFGCRSSRLLHGFLPGRGHETSS